MHAHHPLPQLFALVSKLQEGTIVTYCARLCLTLVHPMSPSHVTLASSPPFASCLDLHGSY